MPPAATLVDEACEKALFASPEQVAASLNYVGARLDLLREISMVAGSTTRAYDSLRTPILRSLEADRFGLVAQVLVARDGCSLSACYAFDLLPQNRQVVSNMSERAYDMRVARFAANWNDKPVRGPRWPRSPVRRCRRRCRRMPISRRPRQFRRSASCRTSPAGPVRTASPRRGDRPRAAEPQPRLQRSVAADRTSGTTATATTAPEGAGAEA